MSAISSIEGKVAAVIDDTTLVLNVGQQQGVHEGMLFAVVAARQEIADPDSGESLGRWEQVKGRVVVTHVQQRMCTARPPALQGTPGSGTLSEMMVRHSFGLYGEHSQAGDRPQLNIVRGVASGRQQQQPIAVGDPVRSIPLDKPDADAPAPQAGSPDLPSQTYASSSPAAGAGADADA